MLALAGTSCATCQVEAGSAIAELLQTFAEFAEVMVGHAVQLAFAVAAQIHQQLILVVRQTQQGAGKRLLVQRGDVLAASGVFHHHLAVALDGGLAHRFRVFHRIDES